MQPSSLYQPVFVRRAAALVVLVAIAALIRAPGDAVQAQTALMVKSGGPYSGTVGQAVAFNAIVCGPAGATFQWDFGDGGTSTQQSPSKVYSRPGNYIATVAVSVAAPGKQSASAITTVTIAAASQSSSGSPGSGQPSSGPPGSGQPSSGAPSGCQSSQPGPEQPGGQPGSPSSGQPGPSGPGQPISAPPGFGQAGTGQPGAGQSGSAQPGAGQPGGGQPGSSQPGAGQGFTISAGGPYAGSAGHPITLTAALSGTPPGSVYYAWDFGDGTSSGAAQAAASVTKTYAAPGTYAVTVTAIAGSGSLSIKVAMGLVAVASTGQVLTYGAGWNLVGAPAGTSFAQAGGPLYTFQAGDSNYRSSQNTQGVDAGEGYWVYFNAPRPVALSGAGTTSASIPAPAGQWVLIGNPSAAASAQVSGAAFVLTYDPSSGNYSESQVLAPGQGAWALSLDGGTITLSAASPAGQP